tara:strand:+ start:249 stop:461 length:213 start_codon:yes stop_codon:yes gene_type:complete
MNSPMKNTAYWKSKHAASEKAAPTRWIGLALGAAKAIGGAIKGHKDRKDALERKSAEAAGKSVANMPKFG